MSSAISRIEYLLTAKQYLSALKELNAVKTLVNTPKSGEPIPAYKLRLMCLEVEILTGLGSLKEAKALGQQIVRLYPRSVDGYVLLGRIYKLLARDEDRKRLYTLAVKRVEKKSDKQLLEGLNEDLIPRTDINAQNNDPFLRLPKEILLYVLELCEFKTPELARCICVCRSWRALIESEQALWSNLDFSMGVRTAVSARKRARVSTVPLTTIKKYCSLSGSNLNINLANTQLQQPVGKVLENLLDGYGKKLRSLVLVEDSTVDSMEPVVTAPKLSILKPILPRSLTIPMLRKLSIASSDPMRDFQWALAKFPQLEHLSFQVIGAAREPSEELKISHDCQLRSVHLTSMDRFSLPSQFLERICALDSLETVVLNKVFVAHEAIAILLLRNLKVLHFVSSGQSSASPVISIPQSIETIEQLVLGQVKIYIPPVVASNLNLLRLSNCQVVSSSLAETISAFRSQETLTTLVIDRSTFRGSDLMAAEPFNKVRSLQLTNLPDLSRPLIVWLKEVFPNVVNLNVDDSVISAATLVEWIKIGVKFLRCRNCPLSVDTMLWLKKINIKVVYN